MAKQTGNADPVTIWIGDGEDGKSAVSLAELKTVTSPRLIVVVTQALTAGGDKLEASARARRASGDAGCTSREFAVVSGDTIVSALRVITADPHDVDYVAVCAGAPRRWRELAERQLQHQWAFAVRVDAGSDARMTLYSVRAP